MAFGNLVLYSSISLLYVAYWFNSSDFHPEEYELPSPPPLTGELSLNKPRILEKILEGKVVGAESIVVEKSTLYTCTMDGNCLKIVDGKIQKIIPLTNQQRCSERTRQTILRCGRPLGIRRQNAEQFIVADSVLGIFAVNFEKGTKELLLSSKIAVDGKEMKFPDDFDYIANDTIIFSDASTRYGFNDFLLAFLEHCGDGRIIQFEMSTGKLKVLVDGLNFPNGVQTHPDKKSILFCESATAKIHRYYFAGPKKGQVEVFADNLPGYPDNIRLAANGKSFYVAMFSHRSDGYADFFQRTGPWPGVRKVFGELVKILPPSAVHFLFQISYSSYGIAIEMDMEGNIIRSFHDPEGNVIRDISQITDDGGLYLYLASFSNDYIGRMSKF